MSPAPWLAPLNRDINVKIVITLTKIGLRPKLSTARSGVRTHAVLRPEDLKSPSLTTRTSVRCERAKFLPYNATVYVRQPPAYDLIIFAPRKDLLTSRSEKYGVLQLRSVRPLYVRQGRVGVHNAFVNKVLQTDQILTASEVVKPSTTKGKCPEVLGNINHHRYCTYRVDALQNVAGSLQRQRDETNVIVLHVV